MRVMLAKLLLEKPSLLMLDEPTNHLDLPSIQWIENYLRSYEGAVIVVSHDREFLNNTAKQIVEVDQQQLNFYNGDYAFYKKEKALRTEIQQGAYENQQQMIKQTEKFIERFRAKATKAKQVQSRAKALNRLDRVEEVANANKQVNFKFDFKQKSGRFISTLENVSKSYGDLEILNNTDAIIERTDKIALIGANGKGKSTLLRIIAGVEKHGGKHQEGFNVNMAFYAQHQLEDLNVDNEILEELKQAGSGKTEMELRSVLGCFLFSGDDVFKKIKVLSGGEKSRVALAKTLISEANFLILDEPTNHLDMVSENILIQALQQYKGSYVIVSHNRHFVNQTANKIWYIEDKEIKEYPGTYEEYDYWLNTNKPKAATKKQKQPAPAKEEKQRTPERKSENVLADNKLKKLNRSLTEQEENITLLELSKTEQEGELAKPEIYGNPESLESATAAYNQTKSDLEEAQSRWETIAEEIDLLEGRN